jgi:hypothetical protein
MTLPLKVRRLGPATADSTIRLRPLLPDLDLAGAVVTATALRGAVLLGWAMPGCSPQRNRDDDPPRRHLTRLHRRGAEAEDASDTPPPRAGEGVPDRKRGDARYDVGVSPGAPSPRGREHPTGSHTFLFE